MEKLTNVQSLEGRLLFAVPKSKSGVTSPSAQALLRLAITAPAMLTVYQRAGCSKPHSTC